MRATSRVQHRSARHPTCGQRGKVRDVYAGPAANLLIVATDRISAFDCILPQGIPGKGRILTQMSLFSGSIFCAA